MTSSSRVDEPPPQLQAFLEDRWAAHRACPHCPAPSAVRAWFLDLMGLLFPPLAERRYASLSELRSAEENLHRRSQALLADLPELPPDRAQALANELRAALPKLHAALAEDAEALVDTDPAASDVREVVRSYPGFRAVAAYRIAHHLYRGGARGLARILAASAHADTAIDIHPAARIGARLRIDHGTGVVIGATSVVGDDVTLYQGVTLGGLRVRKGDADAKRHPTVEDRVVLYANATVLGGETVIGHDAVIGGNVFLTRSVAPHARVSYRPEVRIGDDEA